MSNYLCALTLFCIYNWHPSSEEDSAGRSFTIKVKGGGRSNIKWRESNHFVTGLKYLLSEFRSYSYAKSVLKQLA